MKFTSRFPKFVLAMLACLVLLPASLSVAAEESTTKNNEMDIGVALCTDDGESKPSLAMRTAMVRVVALSGQVKGMAYRVLPCRSAIADSTCFAQSRVLVCRASAIERVMRSAAWLAGKYSDTKPHSYDEFRLSVIQWNVLATQYADRVTSYSAVDASIPGLEEGYVKYQSAGVSTSAEGLAPALQIYIATVDYVLSALVGHELSHALGEQCPIAEKAASEDLGIINGFLSLHQTGELFCTRSPTVEEVRADICGLRHIRKTTASLTKHHVSNGHLEFARRASADLIAFDVTFGWRPRPNAPPGKYPFFELSEYLYAPIRVLAFASELTPPVKGTVSVCGESASLFVFGTQQLFKSCPKANGSVSDDLLALLPPAVEASWNGAQWTPASFSCVGR